MYTYRLTSVVFNNGFSVTPGDMTILIGPNNAGKSRALKEIVWKTTESSKEQAVVVADVDFTLPQSLEALSHAYDVERYPDPHGNWTYRTLNPDMNGQYQSGGGVWPDSYRIPATQSPEDRKRWLITHFGRGLISFLTTEQRLQITKASPSKSSKGDVQNLLQAFYGAGTPIEAIVKSLVKNAFGKEVALDFTVPQVLCLRVGDDFSHVPPDPRDAMPIMDGYLKLDDQGDGIRSFTGIVIALSCLKRSVFLIDEPEAFLHPPQAYRIGRFLADQASSTRQIVLATHSADVLRGILSRKPNVTILRIDRVNDTNSFCPLEPERLNALMTDPLLSSVRVLEGLFYSGAVVAESDSDARFYHSASSKKRSDLDLHFVNADNKQTVPKIIELYRNMGVRCAGIVDFDVLNDHKEFERQLDTLGVEGEEREFCLDIRREIDAGAKAAPPEDRLQRASELLAELMSQIRTHDTAKSSNGGSLNDEHLLRRIDSKCQEISNSTKHWRPLKQHGQSALSSELQAKFDKLASICKSRGLFINPLGELESMLVDYGISYSTEKRPWIQQALKLLPSLEVDESKQPWKFINEVQEYLTTN